MLTLSEKRKFHLIFVHFRSRERKYVGTKVPVTKSTMRVRRMPMHLSLGHVTLMPKKFFPPPTSNFPQSDLGRRADSRWALPQISSLDFVLTTVLTLESTLGLDQSLVKFDLDFGLRPKSSQDFSPRLKS